MSGALPRDPRRGHRASSIDLAVGHLRALEIERDGRRLRRSTPRPGWTIRRSPTTRRSCRTSASCPAISSAPRSAARDDPDVPPHGWPANSRWEHVGDDARIQAAARSRASRCEKRPLGARLIKEITLRDGHPFVYQRHVFEGGAGAISVASHPMTKFATRGRLSFSPKAYAETPPKPLESDPARGRYALAYPARFTDLGAGAAEGRRHDRPPLLSDRRPARGFRHAGRGAGKPRSAGRRRCATDARDIVLSLKNPRGFSGHDAVVLQWRARLPAVERAQCRRARHRGGPRLVGEWLSPLRSRRIRCRNPACRPRCNLDPNGTVEVRHVIGGLPRPRRLDAHRRRSPRAVRR